MIKKNYGKTLKEQLKASAKDKLYRFLMADGMVKGAVVHGTRMINEMKANFDLGVLETLILGHAYLGASLMSSMLKGQDQLALKIDCSGPVKGLSVEANAMGEIRGFLKNNPIPLDKPYDNLTLSPYFGAGFLSVTKFLEDGKSPFTGKIILEYGSVAKDLANYFLKSEQIPTAFSLSIYFDKKGDVTGAGGLFLQAMPGAKESIVTEIEKEVRHLSSIGTEFSLGENPESLVSTVFQNFSPVILSDHRIEFFCRCSEKRILDYIAMLPAEDVEEILENGPFPVETRCHNCNTLYHFSKQDIENRYHRRK
ncbi:MAG: Hsp33 family molecular chaperone HslO [Proteobacteria bacterium]|nr:Hsp33 family molecular chaperone HslO [Pseudomonadota bacterium]